MFGLAWKKAEQEDAKKRQGTRTDIVETFPQSDTGKARDKIGERVGEVPEGDEAKRESAYLHG